MLTLVLDEEADADVFDRPLSRLVAGMLGTECTDRAVACFIPLCDNLRRDALVMRIS